MGFRIPHIPTLAIIAFVSYLLPATSGFIRRRSLSRDLRLLSALYVVYVPIMIANLFLMGRGINTVWLAQLYCLGEFLVYSTVFVLWADSGNSQRVLKISAGVFAGVWLIAKLSFEPLTRADTFTGPLRGMILATMGVFTLIKLYDKNTITVYDNRRFWISMALVIYNIGTLPIFLLANKLLLLSLPEIEKIWAINWVLITLSNIMYSTAFFVGQRDKIPSQIDATLE